LGITNELQCGALNDPIYTLLIKFETVNDHNIDAVEFIMSRTLTPILTRN